MTSISRKSRIRRNRPFVGIPSFLRTRIEADLDAVDADVAVCGAPFDQGAPFLAVVAVVAGQHIHGSKTVLGETYEISRPTVYAAGAAAESVLWAHLDAPLLEAAAVEVRVDDAQLRRAVVALRVVAPNAIRPIKDLVALFYPG